MLTDLRIRDFALIDDLSISFGPGLNLLTGETGAGKSIIVEALGLVTGQRADAQMVRAGSRVAAVEALFEDISAAAAELAEVMGAEPEDGAVILRREVGADGRSRAFVGRNSVPTAALREMGELLVDLHGQHQNRTLLKAETHRDALDQFGQLETLRSSVGQACGAAREAAQRLRALEAALEDRAGRRELLRHQQDELAAAEPRAGEEALLRLERSRLAHAARIASLSGLVQELLAETEGSALERIGASQQALAELGALDPEAPSQAGRLEEARYALEDVAAWARDRASLEADPARLDVVEGRLHLLESLGRKYGGDAEFLARRREGLAAEIAELEEVEDSIRRVREALGAAVASYLERAAVLSQGRREAACRLERDIATELASLAFERVRVQVALALAREDGSPAVLDGTGVAMSPEGYDLAELLFSANPGEPPRPLARIASGGELSRVMLGLNVLLRARPASRGRVPETVVFDEVDAGIGGRAAEAVGERLGRLSAAAQVLCVTHLPQIASRASCHWRVWKQQGGGRTHVRADRLDAEGRIEEIARMLAGRTVTDAARRHAAEMLALAAGSDTSSGIRPRKGTRRSA